MYKILCKDGSAKRGQLETVHGTVQTPVFMNVGTVGAMKGAVATTDLLNLKTQIVLSNTYHLHVRPGDDVVKKMGGIRKFMVWDNPVLTDSGGFQVFSLAGLRNKKKRAFIFIRILMARRFLWDRKKVCRFSRILHRRSQWHLMNVHHIRQQENICKIRWTVQHVG